MTTETGSSSGDACNVCEDWVSGLQEYAPKAKEKNETFGKTETKYLRYTTNAKLWCHGSDGEMDLSDPSILESVLKHGDGRLEQQESGTPVVVTKYAKVRQLGSGSYGRVVLYEGEHNSTRFAIKVCRNLRRTFRNLPLREGCASISNYQSRQGTPTRAHTDARQRSGPVRTDLNLRNGITHAGKCVLGENQLGGLI
jgi:hypothetical protein